MAQGRKTGGRVKGTLNKVTADVATRLRELGCDPIEGMARLAMDKTNPPELRGRMYAELAGYVTPKRKAIEIEAAPGTMASFVVFGVPESTDMAQWSQKHRPAR